MTRTLLSALLAATTLAGAAPAAAATPASASEFLGDIIGNPADAGVINRRCDAFVAEIGTRVAQLAGETGPASLAQTMRRFDDIAEVITGGSGEFTLYRETGADEARRKAGADCEVRIAAEANKLSLSRPVFERIKAIPQAGADPATKLLLTRTLAGFERSGVALPPEQRAKAQALADRISDLETRFNKGIADGRKTITATPAELDGLPADFIAAHKPGADGKLTLATDYTDYVPVMTYARSGDLRRRFSQAYQTRAYPANDAVLREMLNARQELATLLGRKDHATLVLENKMLNTPEKVEKLLADMAAVARPIAMRDYERKLALYRLDHPGAASFNMWDNAYLSQQIQKRDYAYDRQEARKYFNYVAVRDGILQLSQDLFGVEIRPWNTPVWDPGVEAYEVLDHGKLIGRFYFDSHPRPGKYEHGNAISLRAGIAGRAVPVGVLVMNMPAGTELMEHNDVETFLHEFGHLLHGIFGGQTQQWVAQSGVTTEWDFVEAPSQMLEEWVYDYETLSRFARDASGKPIPRELVDKMNKARFFDLGMQDMRQLGLSNISLHLHEGLAPADLGARTREIEGAYDVMPYPEWVQMQDSFTHLAGYSAVYYTYRWSKVIADDMFTRFHEHGLRDPATALRYRNLVLAPGGTKPAAELVEGFLGRPISLDAYKADIARDN